MIILGIKVTVTFISTKTMPGYKRRYSSLQRRGNYAKRPRYSKGYGTSRTGGNYNQVYRRRNPRTGRYYYGGGPELKYIDQVGSSSTAIVAVGAGTGGIAGTAQLELLNGLTQGTDSITRIGRKICMKSIQGRWTFTLQNTAAGVFPAGLVGGQVRLLIVYDKQANGAAPAATDILQGTGIIQAPLNLNNRERFIVLVDKFITLDPNDMQSGMIRFYKKLPRDARDVIFNAGNAGTIGDIQTGSVYALWQCSAQATAGTTLSGALYNRIRFLDD